MPTKSIACVTGKARVAKIRALKTPLRSSTPWHASLSETPTSSEKENDSNLSNNIWQNILQQDLTTQFPITPSITSTAPLNYIFEHPASLPTQPTQVLPSITPLLGTVKSNPQQDRVRDQALTGKEFRSLPQQIAQLKSPSYVSRVEDISTANGEFPPRHQGENEICIRSRHITATQTSMWKPHNRQRWVFNRSE